MFSMFFAPGNFLFGFQKPPQLHWPDSRIINFLKESFSSSKCPELYKVTLVNIWGWDQGELEGGRNWL